MRRVGMGYDAIFNALALTNRKRCQPPLDEQDIVRIAKSAARYAPHEIQGQNEAGRVEVEDVCLADRTVKVHEWLWPGRIPMKSVSLIGGDPGVGKSFLTLFMTATISRGAPWPDCSTSAKQGTVVIIGNEDPIDEQMLPRIKTMNPNLENIHVFPFVREKGEKARECAASIVTHEREIYQRLAKYRGTLRCVIIDPLLLHIGGKVNSNDYTQLGDALKILTAWADDFNAAIIGVTHFNKKSDKSALYRFLGSMSLMGNVRAAWVVARDETFTDYRRLILAEAKNSYQPGALALGYQIQSCPVPGEEGLQNGCVVFEAEPFKMTADEALRLPNDPRTLSE